MVEKYNKTLAFYGWSLVLPWILWFTLAYMSHHVPEGSGLSLLEPVLGILGLVSPLLVASRYYLADKALLADIKGRALITRGYSKVYLGITVLLIPASLILGQFISLLFGHGLDQFHISGKPSFTSLMFSPWFILVFAPVVEELAWHSYGTDTLRRKFSLFSTSMIFALYWVVWHLPLSFIKGYYHSNMVAEGPVYALNFVFSLFVFIIIMNRLYYKTKRNLLVAILFHLSANITNEIFATHPDSKVIQTVLLLFGALVILYKDREMFFTKETF